MLASSTKLVCFPWKLKRGSHIDLTYWGKGKTFSFSAGTSTHLAKCPTSQCLKNTLMTVIVMMIMMIFFETSLSWYNLMIQM